MYFFGAEPFRELRICTFEKQNLRLLELNMTKRELALKIGVSPSRISDYISGRSEPTLAVARSISKELNIDPDIILGVE